ncbi:hypothetical protein ILUMI_01204, partial [Ignelater luminosus]
MWNARGFNGKQQELLMEFEDAKVALVLLSETKMKGKDFKMMEGSLGLWYSGVDACMWGQRSDLFFLPFPFAPLKDSFRVTSVVQRIQNGSITLKRCGITESGMTLVHKP